MGQVTFSGSTIGNALEERRDYYVYVFFRPWNGIPCYIGKGRGNRWRQEKRPTNKQLDRIIAKAACELPKVRIRHGLTNAEAYEIEKAFIKAIGRGKNGPLVNLTDGGEGAEGYVHTKKSRRKMSKKGKGKPKSEAHKEAIRVGVAAYHARMTNEEKEHRSAVIQVATIEAMANPDVKKKISDKLSGTVHSAERRLITSNSLKAMYENRPDLKELTKVRFMDAPRFAGRTHTDETKQKMSTSQLATAARKKAARA